MLAIVAIDRLEDGLDEAARDRALQVVGATLRGHCRAGDRVYRTERDTFVLLLPEQSLSGGQAALERLRRTVAYLELPRGGDGGGHLSVSAGIARIQRGEDSSPERALERAGEALAEAVRAGGDRVCIREAPRYALGMNLAARRA